MLACTGLATAMSCGLAFGNEPPESPTFDDAESAEVAEFELTLFEVRADETDATVPEASVSEANDAIGLAGRARQAIVGEDTGDYSSVERHSSTYEQRTNRIINGAHDWISFETAGEWWARRNQESWGGGVETVSVQEFVANHVYTDMPEPDVDFYDQKPIAISASPIEQVSAQEETPVEDQSPRRLRTDIRSIKPSLSYALKNVERKQLPADFDTPLVRGEYVPRATTPTVLQWAPTNFYHYPLYFEDPALERYGHTYHPLVQPFASTGRFATQLVGLPYQMALSPVHSHEYALGYYRPGEVAPKKLYQIPFNEEATVMQAAAIVGLILVVP